MGALERAARGLTAADDLIAAASRPSALRQIEEATAKALAFDKVARGQSAVADMLATSERYRQLVEGPSAQIRAFEEALRKPSAVADALAAAERQTELIRKTSAQALIFERYQSLSPNVARLVEMTQQPAYLDALARMTDPASQIHRSNVAMLLAQRPAGLDRLAEIAAGRVSAFYSAFLGRDPWSTVLARRMGAIDAEWVLAEDPEASAEAFARMGRLADATRYGEPFTDETTEIIVEELGVPSQAPEEIETVEAREERFDEAGRARELIAFPPVAYREVLVSSGFGLVFPAPPVVATVEPTFEPFKFSPETGYLLQSLEAHLRQHVSLRLEALDGAAWVRRRVQPGVRDRWKARQDDARAAGKPVFALIHYADFMDLLDIIVARNNWPQFVDAFRCPLNLRVSLLRLYNIRNDGAHSRPLALSDILFAMAEGGLIFRSLGLPIEYRT